MPKKREPLLTERQEYRIAYRERVHGKWEEREEIQLGKVKPWILENRMDEIIDTKRSADVRIETRTLFEAPWQEWQG